MTGVISGAVVGDRRGLELIEAAYRLHLEAAAPQLNEQAIERFVDLLAPSVVFWSEDGPACHGQHGVAELLRRASQQWGSVSYELEELSDLGQRRFLAVGKVVIRSAERVADAAVPFINLWRLRDGRAARIESFGDYRRALEAAQQ